jgi:hypothetical protein
MPGLQFCRKHFAVLRVDDVIDKHERDEVPLRAGWVAAALPCHAPDWDRAYLFCVGPGQFEHAFGEAAVALDQVGNA